MDMKLWKKTGCTDKVTYRNKSQAFHYALLYQQVPYKCRFCSRFHLTTQGLRG